MTINADAFDYAQLAPGIRKTVRLLRHNGFETTDSGDGVANVSAGIEGAMDVPMVVCRVEEDDLLAKEARRLWRLVRQFHDGPEVRIEASYSPHDDVSVIVMTGFDDRYINTENGL